MVRACGKRLAALVWRTGRLSERWTAVGRRGRRLGVFAAMAPLAGATARLITEAAHYSNPDDRAIMDAPGFADRQAAGLLLVYADLAAARLR